MQAGASADDQLRLVIVAFDVIRNATALQQAGTAGLASTVFRQLVTFDVMPTAQEPRCRCIEAAEALSTAPCCLGYRLR